MSGNVGSTAMSSDSGNPVAGYQAWRDLLFAHWRLPADSVQAVLPEGLTVETFDGDAWVGLVPFSMERIRPWWFPPVPGISWFLETNLRTYVKDKSGRTGVWFFSLDADNRIAVWTARTFWNLNYRNAVLSLQQSNTGLNYHGKRRDGSAEYSLVTPTPKGPLQTAAEGTLEFFLLERYHLFAEQSGQFWYGQVHHAPYEFQPVESLSRCSQTLTVAAGLPACNEPPVHVAWSPGVDVSVSKLQKIRP